MEVHSPSARRSRAVHHLLGGGAVLAACGILAGCTSPKASRPADYEPVVAQFFIEGPAAMTGAVTMTMPRSEVQVTVSGRPVLNESDIANVELVHVDLGLCLLFEFRGDAGKALYRMTAGNLGRRIVVALNGRPFGARVIDGAITDGRLYMFIEMRDDELRATAVSLKRTTGEIQAALARGRKR